VLVVLKAIFMLEPLNRLVVLLTAGPKKVKGTRFWLDIVAIDLGVCFLRVSLFLRLYMMLSGKPLLFPITRKL